MSDGELTAELQKFIARYIGSVEKLEILLLLCRAPDKAWCVSEVYQKIQSSHTSIILKLRDLEVEGFAQRESNDCFRYQPKSQELKAQVDALDLTYQTRRIKVIESIFSKTTDEHRKFAEAFRIRKEKE